MLSYRIDVQTKIVHILGRTPSDVREFNLLMQVIFADPKFGAGFSFLRDRTGMEALGKDLAQEAGVALRKIKGMPTCKFAVVVDDGTSLRAIQVVKLMTEGTWVEFAVFGLVEAAKDWLRQPSLLPEEAVRRATA